MGVDIGQFCWHNNITNIRPFTEFNGPVTLSIKNTVYANTYARNIKITYKNISLKTRCYS